MEKALSLQIWFQGHVRYLQKPCNGKKLETKSSYLHLINYTNDILKCFGDFSSLIERIISLCFPTCDSSPHHSRLSFQALWPTFSTVSFIFFLCSYPVCLRIFVQFHFVNFIWGFFYDVFPCLQRKQLSYQGVCSSLLCYICRSSAHSTELTDFAQLVCHCMCPYHLLYTASQYPCVHSTPYTTFDIKLCHILK